MHAYILVHRSMLNHILSHLQRKVTHGKEPRGDGGGGRPSEIKFRQGYIARAFHFLKARRNLVKSWD